MKHGKIELIISKNEDEDGNDDDDTQVAYLMLPDHPGAGIVGAAPIQKRLRDFMQYDGADIYFCLDKDGRLIGIEILA